MDMKRQRVLLAASVVGLLAAGAEFSRTAQALENGEEEGGSAHCYGINKCKGTGDCGGKGHSCSGQNACKGQGYIDLDQDTCLRIEGGRLTPEPAS